MNKTNFPLYIQRLITGVISRDGASSSGLREQVMSRAAEVSTGEPSQSTLPKVWEPYIDTIIKHAYKVTDSHTNRLLAAGQTEDEIFELTIAAAIGAGIVRLDQGLSAIEAASGNRS